MKIQKDMSHLLKLEVAEKTCGIGWIGLKLVEEMNNQSQNRESTVGMKEQGNRRDSLYSAPLVFSEFYSIHTIGR